MPPRAVKKASGGSTATKRTASRTARGGPKAQVRAEDVKEEVSIPVVEFQEEMKAGEASASVVETKENIREEEFAEEKLEALESMTNGPDKDDGKDTFEVDDKGERLELDDNDPEYEETAVDYDEKEMEDDDNAQVEGVEVEEYVDGDDAVEEEVIEMAEEIEDGGEDVEGEEYEEHYEEEHEHYEDLEEHQEVVKERRKRKEFEVFVGGLDKDAKESDLRKVFSAVGEIVEIRLMMNHLTNRNKGFAFLRYATVEQAKRAVLELKNPVVNGKQCGVAPSKDSDTLFLGNICKTWTKEHLKETLRSYGIENFVDLNLSEDSNDEGMNRGFAFLEFSSRRDAIDAYRHLQKRDVMLGVDRPAKISLADSFIQPDDEVMAQVKTVFVDGIPASWDEDRVKGCLKEFGEIEKIELARNMPNAKRKDFGFVTFDTHDSAVSCADGINNQELGEGNSKVKVRARLSRPLQRGRGKPGSRGDFRSSRGPLRGSTRSSWSSRPPPRRIPGGVPRQLGGRAVPAGGYGSRRTIDFRERRPVVAPPERARRLPPPVRSYERRPPPPEFPKSSSKREYSRHDELASRSRVAAAAAEYGSRILTERRSSSYRDEFSSRGSSYSDMVPRSAPRAMERRPYADEVYGRKPEWPIPAYREARSRDYDPISGSKRSYSAMDDAPPRYPDVNMRHSRARIEYGVSGSSAQYEDAYAERLGRSHAGYGGSRSNLCSHESHGLHGSHQGISYGGGSVSGRDVSGMYSSGFSGSYLSRGSDQVGSGSYSSSYSGRNMSGSGYLGGSGSSSYY
ncbi:Polyadenylate-binding protein (RRM superfamily) protein [Dioscorea alata]|uniref:Polyadenylate-binding protein (RRM superfamily) protein n=2 Tax=Dioscorea alata TaxID=55571 RepID=A0ACB7V5M8_DIOAL|nr:Polyadenylate-binding protein (RRM superfamily) protein [Dioscorea alata]KAH7668620.1 Polyadenylate-binding protein (RRM superfamily) protein [Dioscorea alata]